MTKGFESYILDNRVPADLLEAREIHDKAREAYYEAEEDYYEALKKLYKELCSDCIHR